MRILNPALSSEASEPVLAVPGYPTTIMRSAGLRSKFAAFVILRHCLSVLDEESRDTRRKLRNLCRLRTITKHFINSLKERPCSEGLIDTSNSIAAVKILVQVAFHFLAT